MTRLGSFIRLSRPHFLLGGALLHLMGAISAPGWSGTRFLLGQAMVSAMQVTAHFVNEYADFDADRRVRNRTPFSGGSGVLARGDLERRLALRAAVASSVAGIVLAGMVAVRSPVAAALGAVALAVSWGYSMPPVRLLGTGWGEPATSIVVTAVVPLIGVTLQGGTPPPALWSAMAGLVLLHMAMMLAFELPDLSTDAAAGKRVLAVRWGRARTVWMMAGFLATGLTVLAVRAAAASDLAAWSPLVATAPAVLLVASAPGDRHVRTTAAAVATLLFAAAGSTWSLAG